MWSRSDESFERGLATATENREADPNLGTRHHCMLDAAKDVSYLMSLRPLDIRTYFT